MEETKALIVNMRPNSQKLRDERIYTEVDVKKILYSFARDLDCKWSKKGWKHLLKLPSTLTEHDNDY